MRVTTGFWTRRGHIKHGYCSNNNASDHLVIRNTWLRETFTVQNMIAFSFLCIRGTHVQIPVVSPPLSPKGIRKRIEMLELDKGRRAPCKEPGEQAARFPDFRTSFGGSLTCPLMRRQPQGRRPLASSELQLFMGDWEKWRWGEGGRSAANCSVLTAASNSPLSAEAGAEAPVPLLER